MVIKCFKSCTKKSIFFPWKFFPAFSKFRRGSKIVVMSFESSSLIFDKFSPMFRQILQHNQTYLLVLNCAQKLKHIIANLLSPLDFPHGRKYRIMTKRQREIKKNAFCWLLFDQSGPTLHILWTDTKLSKQIAYPTMQNFA